MNEGTKTGLFWLGSLIVAAVAVFVSLPRGVDEQDSLTINKALFEEFTDPLTAANLKIVTYNETLGELESFEIAKDRQSGVWNIPSRQGYPADAADQMQKAATTLLDVRILDVASVNAEDHEDFGVLEPVIDKLRVGDTGVGRLVSVKSEDGTTLASLIIGNEVLNEEGNVYVRVPNQDPVYKVKLDESPLTTKFSDWIEDDLLQLSSFDIAGTKIRNYSVALGGGLQQLSIDMDNSYDANLSLNDSNEWQLDSLNVYDEKNAGSAKELEGEESLNTEALNKMKNALDDLKIVDVVRKPDGMSSDLKADKSLVENNQSLQSLVTRGFYPVNGPGEEGLDILSANGETTVDLKDGIQYVLRFGSIAGLSEEDGDEADAEDPSAEPVDTSGANRYLLVTTRVNEAMIPTPELKVVPQTYEELQEMLNPQPAAPVVQENPLAQPETAPAKENAEESPEKSGEEATGEQPTAEEKPADQPATTEADTPATTDSPADVGNGDGGVDEQPAVTEATGDGSTEVSGSGEGSGQGQEPATEIQEPAGEQTPAGETTEVEPSVDAAATTNDGAEAAIEPPANADQPVKDELTEEEKKELLQAEQEKLIKENQRLRDEWRGKVDAAKNRVRELNARFADWYYIIPESTYRDLQLALDTLIQPKSALQSQPPAGPQFQFPGM